MSGLSNVDWGLIWRDRGQLLDGLRVAVEVAAVALVISVVAGLLLAVMRMSKPPLSWIAWLYINIFRGVPALVTGLWVFFGLSLVLGVNLSVFQAGVITLTLLYSAFIAEIYRAALSAVPNGFREAGQALGMRNSRVFVSVTLPQATKIAVPNIGSMFIGMIKDTSTLTLIGLAEVVRNTQNLVVQNYQYFALYTAAALIYVIAAFLIDLIFKLIESGYTVPPRGWLSRLMHVRKRKRIERVVSQLATA
ncbi:MAG TPA: amino acid ABC transporter permease [Jatrophihabitans sp.]|nr:amino acid ABC transporter permease [Jatrophihabitans sp.]